MLNKLRGLLPDFEVTKDGNVFDFKRKKSNGQYLHIPAIIFKSSNLEEIAEGIIDAWKRYAEHIAYEHKNGERQK